MNKKSWWEPALLYKFENMTGSIKSVFLGDLKYFIFGQIFFWKNSYFLYLIFWSKLDYPGLEKQLQINESESNLKIFELKKFNNWL